MRKILFNDRFGLTQAVLEGRKTMTRRILKAPRTMEGKDVYGIYIVKDRAGDVVEVMAIDEDGATIGNILPKYKIGEIVSVAQKYKDIMPYLADSFRQPSPDYMMDKPGYNNKMFVRADLMPHQIRITNIRVERIQDISNEDCLKEGIYLDKTAPSCYRPFYTFQGSQECGTPVGYPTAREAFAYLFDKISGKGIWDMNPWVFVYEFELVK